MANLIPYRDLDASGVDIGVKRCGQFIRRVRPQGHTLTCEAPATHMAVSTLPGGRKVNHICRCEDHATDRILRSYVGKGSTVWVTKEGQNQGQ